MKDIKKYIYKNYSKKFPLLFNKEKYFLKKILPKNSRIFHIGSTSVPGLGGKGIIDIYVTSPKKLIIKFKKLLENNKYEFHEAGGSKNRLFFEKIYKNKNKLRTVHLHLGAHNSIDFKKAMSFAEFIKNNEKYKLKYIKLKKEAVKFARGEGAKYRKYKNKFIKIVTKEAMGFKK